MPRLRDIRSGVVVSVDDDFVATLGAAYVPADEVPTKAPAKTPATKPAGGAAAKGEPKTDDAKSPADEG